MLNENINFQISKLREALDSFDEKIRELERQAAPIREELEHWIAIAKLRNGGSLPSEAGVVSLDASSAEEEDSEGTESYGSKTRKLRDYLWQRGDAGATMRELSEYSVSIGARPNFPYNWINRLSKGDKPEITKRGERVFPTEFISVER